LQQHGWTAARNLYSPAVEARLTFASTNDEDAQLSRCSALKEKPKRNQATGSAEASWQRLHITNKACQPSLETHQAPILCMVCGTTDYLYE
jgi:hypothetical protein